MRATNPFRQLRHPIPPPPQEIPPRRNMSETGFYDRNVPGVVTVLEPTPSSPLSSVLGEIPFVRKTPSRPECRIGTSLAAAALTPGPIKHGKEVDIDPLHVYLAHVHASMLKATAKQHEIRLTGELVSCPACSRAKGYLAPIPHHAMRRATQSLALAWVREEENASNQRQKKRDAEEADKVEVAPGVTVASLRRFRTALIGPTQGLPKRRRLCH